MDTSPSNNSEAWSRGYDILIDHMMTHLSEWGKEELRKILAKQNQVNQRARDISAELAHERTGMQTVQEVAATLSGAPPQPEETKKRFDPLEWARILASQVGVTDPMPMELFTTCSNKIEVNRKFFEWRATYTTPPTSEQFSPLDLVNFKTKVVPQLRAKDELIRERNEHEARINRFQRDMQNYLQRIAEISTELIAFSEVKAIDLTAEIESIVKDGWYQFDSGRSATVNGTTDFYTLVFNTPRVNLAYYNKAAGVEMNVDMGRFRVHYAPGRGRVQVYKFEDNIEASDSYYHPHVDTSGGVCWGNAGPIYTKVATSFKPSELFNALRVILQTYNDGSPYRDIMEFALVRNPELMAAQPTAYVEEEELAWVWGEELPANATADYIHEEEEHEDDDDNDNTRTRYMLTIFTRQYTNLGTRVPGTGYFIKLNDGTYTPIAASHLDWM